MYFIYFWELIYLNKKFYTKFEPQTKKSKIVQNAKEILYIQNAKINL